MRRVERVPGGGTVGAGGPAPGGAPWLVTQFTVPSPPASAVARPRLGAVLREGLERSVTLLCAPAGSGKTSLLSAELGGEAPRPAWVSLGEADDEPGRFWGGVLTALHAAGAVPADSALAALAPPVRESRGSFMPLFVNALAELPEPVVLVLDDLHVLRSRECLAQLSFLVLHAPPTLRLVLSSRSDPALPLHLLRLSGGLTQIRAVDLAFTEAEAAELFATHGLALPGPLVRTLCARTEGWGAGLRLAALSLQDREDPERFVAEFAGDDRAVGDYLLAEVLDRQPPRLRRFLLRTAVVDRICGDLADAMTGADSGAETLAALELTNGFVIGLDSHRDWYRYHRLFARLLRTRARAEIADELPGLHSRAAQWYADNGAEALALHHAVEARDWSLAAEVAASHWFDLFVRGESAALRMLVDVLPAEQLEGDAELAAALACTALEAGDAEAARLQLEQAATAEPGLPEGRRRAFLETMALARLYLARRDCDFEAALAAADTLLLEAAEGGGWSHDARRALVHATLGETALWAHRLDRARTELEVATGLARAIGLDYVLVAAMSHLAMIDYLARGTEDATVIAEEAIALAERRGWSAIPQTACAHATLGAVALHLELRPDLAEEHVARGLQAVANVDARQASLVLTYLRARIRAAQGRPDEGLRELARYEAAHPGGPGTPYERVAIAAMRSRLLGALGDLEGARDVVEEVRGEPAPMLAEAQARLLLAAGDPSAAAELLAPVVEQGGYAVTRVELAVLYAIARDECREPGRAAAALENALALAEENGHRWPFIEAGRRMEGLLRSQIRAGTAHRAVAGELIAAFEDRLPVRRSVAPLLEPLSDREQVILRYLPTTLSNREIASELFVSTNTVKTHLRSIYRKLDVARRRDAVDRARDLRLLSGGLGR